jgi:hypothetical protein
MYSEVEKVRAEIVMVYFPNTHLEQLIKPFTWGYFKHLDLSNKQDNYDLNIAVTSKPGLKNTTALLYNSIFYGYVTDADIIRITCDTGGEIETKIVLDY